MLRDRTPYSYELRQEAYETLQQQVVSDTQYSLSDNDDEDDGTEE